MKRLISLLLLVFFLFAATACDHDDTKDSTLKLYYPNHQVVYGRENGLISYETLASMEEGVVTALQNYLKGPTDLTHRNPFPYNTRMISLKEKETMTTLMLSDEFAALSGIDLTIACVCLARTTFSLTGATSVAITCETLPIDGEQTLVFHEDAMLFLDTGIGSEAITPLPTTTPQ